MNIRTNKLQGKHKPLIKENLKQAKQYAAQGKITGEELKKLADADPTPQKKFVGWMAKVWIKDKPDFDDLRNTVEEYNVFLNKGKAKTKDINQFKSFEELKDEVHEINTSGAGISVKDLERDYETVIDNSDILACVPHTHEASRKLGLTKFRFRFCADARGNYSGDQDSAWCTTYAAPDHWNDYYYKQNVTFYYVKVKSEKMVDLLIHAFPQEVTRKTPDGEITIPRGAVMEVVAIALLEGGQMDAYDGLDKQIDKGGIDTFLRITGIE